MKKSHLFLIFLFILMLLFILTASNLIVSVYNVEQDPKTETKEK